MLSNWGPLLSSQLSISPSSQSLSHADSSLSLFFVFMNRTASSLTFGQWHQGSCFLIGQQMGLTFLTQRKYAEIITDKLRVSIYSVHATKAKNSSCDTTWYFKREQCFWEKFTQILICEFLFVRICSLDWDRSHDVDAFLGRHTKLSKTPCTGYCCHAALHASRYK